jgi:hypothetical protein
VHTHSGAYERPMPAKLADNNTHPINAHVVVLKPTAARNSHLTVARRQYTTTIARSGAKSIFQRQAEEREYAKLRAQSDLVLAGKAHEVTVKRNLATQYHQTLIEREAW